QKSRRAKPGSPWRDFYVWSDTPEKYRDARIIFTDFETSNWAWDPVAKAYYWHRFYSHQPDLNYDNPAVVDAIFKVVDYWFEMGVDGLRMDAVPYLFEREGTNCENLPETYEFIAKLRAHVDERFKDKMVLAEANQWPEDAAKYFGNGDQCHMAFHFPLMPRLFVSTWMEDRFPIIDILDQTPEIPENCQWALFLRNHDELTLEMVSDEERDYMYSVFAKDPTTRINVGIRRRLAPLLGNNRRKIELMNILLMSLPGTPVIYYGDEIGMGDNHYLGDRDGVRTAMQWSGDRNGGFSRANPQRLFLPVIIDPEYHHQSVNVENQEGNLSSPLWWLRREIAIRKRFKAFSRGNIEFINSDNPKVLAFVRSYEDERILVVVNLSRFSQPVALELSEFDGYTPEEVVSGNEFPTIREEPYVLTLGFYDYYWFTLEDGRARAASDESSVPELSVKGNWLKLFDRPAVGRFEKTVLPGYLNGRRWFGGKARAKQQVKVVEHMPVGSGLGPQLCLLEVSYRAGSSETYMLPLAFAPEGEQEELADNPGAIVCRLNTERASGVLYDAVYNPDFRANLLGIIARRKKTSAGRGRLLSHTGEGMSAARLREAADGGSQVVKVEQSNTSIIYDGELFLKLYRRQDEGENPDLEIGRFLTQEAKYPNIAAYAGDLEFERPGSEPMVLGMLQKFVQNNGDAWSVTVDAASRYFDLVLEKGLDGETPPPLDGDEPPPLLMDLIGPVYTDLTRLLGVRTGELHLALNTPTEAERFKAETFTLLYQRSLYHAMRSQTRQGLDQLRKSRAKLPDAAGEKADKVLRVEKEILERLARLFREKIPALKIRIHGDYHLGQLLFTGNDFIVIDFEGEPARPIGERRIKRSPLRDVAGMLRSFHYSGYVNLFTTNTLTEQQVTDLTPWAEAWYATTSRIFLSAYLETLGDTDLIPPSPQHLQLLLDSFLLHKAVYEVGYELNNRPDWASIPLQGIVNLMENDYENN
ncbi:maltose alpha-D-glucosyltransferase, partial [Salinispira pacifica]